MQDYNYYTIWYHIHALFFACSEDTKLKSDRHRHFSASSVKYWLHMQGMHP